MKKSILTFGTALLCAGVVVAFTSSKKHVEVQKLNPKTNLTCPTVYGEQSYVQCNNGFIYYGDNQGGGEWAYPSCACADHGGPDPVFPY